MTYAERMAEKPAVAERHADYEQFLFEHIADIPATATESYTDWEFDHASSQRFYVGGLRWFMRQTGISEPARLAAYGPKAAIVCENETTWFHMPNSGDHWKSCSLNQFRAAKNRQPLFYQKAALVILACELALTDMIRSGQNPPKETTVADIYSHMSIVPACWNINDFDKTFLKSIESRDAESVGRVRDAARQSAKTFLDHMATGYTVSSTTAYAVKHFIDAEYTGLNCGAVRAAPGTHLGKLNATAYEAIDVG